MKLLTTKSIQNKFNVCLKTGDNFKIFRRKKKIISETGLAQWKVRQPAD